MKKWAVREEGEKKRTKQERELVKFGKLK